MAASSEKIGIEIRGAIPEPFHRVLTPHALQFVATLGREFNPRRKASSID